MKIKTQLTAFFAISAFLFASCTNTTKAPETALNLDSVKVEIQKLEDGYAAGEKAKDADAIAAYYSDDAINYSSNEEPTVGKAAIKEKIASRIANDTSGDVYSYSIVDVFAEGMQAVEVGTWTKTDTAGKEVDKGHFMSVFEKRDGKYICIRDMSVSSMPAKPAM
ncbi:Ketosteroid isomerase homolog [Daejeonella rubra]|uniref:Ketosteroid isomerase homolog n=1 Tax=Daejeonella rubra TaxID=990371 RepID=A0A1G9R699_9SPHI|nr:nuclear transport factor 2 family protein [Daejeonella rubra]SDM18842.1 Ketosteroid isomerase homolog [Daejeonella rubra]